MKNKLFILLFAISAFFAGCAEDDFETVINLGDGSQDSDSEQVALSGEVKDEQGNPIAGVLVSDGYQTTTTNEEGYYEIYSDLTRSRFVYITTPKDFEIQYENGIPKFWKNIPKGVLTFKGDFVLTRRTSTADRYTILMTADPQIRGKHMNSDNLMFHSVDIYQDLCQDLMDAAAKITDRPVYSICLGDMVHNDMSMWDDYCDGIKNFNFPVFHVIGNHDHIQNVETDEESLAEYERYLGPTNYGVELGDLHYIFIDNIVMKDNRNCPKTTGEYIHGLSDQVVEWLRGYLAHVDKNKTLMLITHSPFYKKVASDPAQSDMNASVYTSLLQPYKYIHSWAGHTHEYFNYVFSKENPNLRFVNVENHVLGRSTGMLGLNASVTADGGPRGYLVLEVDGENISWKFKPCLYEKGQKIDIDEDLQIRCYTPNDVDMYNTGLVYANIWNYDAYWGPVYYSDSGKTKAVMQQDSYYDGLGNYLYEEFKNQYSAMKYVTTPHMFSIKPSEGATSATIETTDRFGNHFSTTIEW